MATIPSLFEEFLSRIRPTDQQQQDQIQGHETLRVHLKSDDTVSEFYVGDFLQGSYRRWTAVKAIGDEKSDVDIILVTKLDKNEYAPNEAMDKCVPFLNTHYAGRWSTKDRAFQIDEGSVELDLVLTAAPSEAAMAAMHPDGSLGSLGPGEALWATQSDKLIDALNLTFRDQGDDWKDEPLDIPDRRLKEWDKTHPLKTIAWTIDKNSRTDGHYVNVVKAIKWWRRVNDLESDRPKSYPLEHIVGHCCPDTIQSVAEGITRSFEEIMHQFVANAENNTAPFLPAHGLPGTDVFGRIDGDDFASFYDDIEQAAELARTALDHDDPTRSSELWRDLLGDEFPLYGKDHDTDGDAKQTAQFRYSSKSTNVSDQRFA